MTEHKHEWCSLCAAVHVCCGTCGNNSCNGGYGQLPDGSKCPDCPSAYNIMLNPTKEQLQEAFSLLSEKAQHLQFFVDAFMKKDITSDLLDMNEEELEKSLKSNGRLSEYTTELFMKMFNDNIKVRDYWKVK